MSTVEDAVRDDLAEQPDFDERGLRRRVLVLVAIVAAVVAVITLAPGLADLRDRFSHAQWQWLVLGAGLKLLSGLCYVAAFRAVFCPSMSWRLSGQIGFSELGANAVFPTGGAGGLALGVWALRRAGMPAEQVGRRTVAFFFLTSVPNVLGVIILGFGLATGLFEGNATLALTLVPALVATLAIVLAIASGSLAASLRRRLRRTRGPRRGCRARLVCSPAGCARRSCCCADMTAGCRRADRLPGLRRDDPVGHVPRVRHGPPLAIIWIGYLIGELGGLIPVPGGIGGVDLGLVGASSSTTSTSTRRPPPCSRSARSRYGSRPWSAASPSCSCAARSPENPLCARRAPSASARAACAGAGPGSGRA